MDTGPPGIIQKVSFRRFLRTEVQNYVRAIAREEIGTILEVKTAEFFVNPTSISWDKPKIIQKVPTQRPERFVILDWGSDLWTVTMDAQTGRLVPEEQDLLNELAIRTGGALPPSPDIESAVTQLMPYFDIIQLSRQHRGFLNLLRMYDEFDADEHMLFMDYGPGTFRGYFQNLSFEQAADEPWNWTFTIEFSVLKDLGTFFKKEGDVRDYMQDFRETLKGQVLTRQELAKPRESVIASILELEG